MESNNNYFEERLNFSPVMHDLAFGVAFTILALVIICIFCTIYNISATEERSMRVQMNQINELRIVAPPNTANI